jgi:hypothetical protein
MGKSIFTEKYGMEYRKAYWDEPADTYLVARHQREIFPLLRKRYIFAEAHNFLMYDFYSPEGSVNEDVFAYSNMAGNERALVVYHNKFANAHGWIRISAAYPIKNGEGEEKTLVQKSLGEGLGLSYDKQAYTIFRLHQRSEYLRTARSYRTWPLRRADAYKCHVFFKLPRGTG